MSCARWQHLDWEPPAAREPAAAPVATDGSRPTPRPTGLGGDGQPHPPEIAQALAYFRLQQWPQAEEAARAAIEAHPQAPAAHRALGLALGRLCEWPAAHTALERAVQLGDAEPLTILALASLEVMREQPQTAIVLLADDDLGDPGAALLAAAEWLQGRSLLSDDPIAAATAFAAAQERFAAIESAERPARLAAGYVSEALALLLADEIEAAQTLYARRAKLGLSATPAVGDFAANLYQICELLTELPADERAQLRPPLREAVTGARLLVSFYDGLRPVSLRWVDLGLDPVRLGTTA